MRPFALNNEIILEEYAEKLLYAVIMIAFLHITTYAQFIKIEMVMINLDGRERE